MSKMSLHFGGRFTVGLFARYSPGLQCRRPAPVRRLASLSSRQPAIRSKIRPARCSSTVQGPYVDPVYSYAYGSSREHLVYSTVDRELRNQVKNKPHELAFFSHHENKRITFKQLDDDTNRLVKCLVNEFNIKKGDSVGVFAYNCYQWLVIQFACSRLGALLAPINPSYKSNELAFVLSSSRVKCLFLPGPKSAQVELNNHLDLLQSDEILAKSREGSLELRHAVLIAETTDDESGDRSPVDFKLANCRLHDWSFTQANDGNVFGSVDEAKAANQFGASACIVDPAATSPDDPFAVYYTSGTTGKPKGACVSNFAVVNNVRLSQIRLRDGQPRESRIRMATALPLFHMFAGVLNAVGPLTSNTCLVFPGHKYDIEAFVESIIAGECNMATLTPTILIDLLSHVELRGLSDRIQLRLVQSGGAALPPEVVTRAFKVLPQLESVRLGYGATETSGVTSFQNSREPEQLRAWTVGPPVDFTEVRVVEPHSDRVLAHGEHGEIQSRGHNTMIGYLGQPDKTGEVLTPSGWYRSGDIGFMHPHGSIQISGRLKHMIIKGGENVYPEEIRATIIRLAYVEDVHVVGVPDERFGEQICAWVKLKSGFSETKTRAAGQAANEVHKEDVIDFCKRNITYFKVPKYLFFVDDFPMTATKKVQNHKIAELSCQWLGLSGRVGH